MAGAFTFFSVCSSPADWVYLFGIAALQRQGIRRSIMARMPLKQFVDCKSAGGLMRRSLCTKPMSGKPSNALIYCQKFPFAGGKFFLLVLSFYNHLQ
ncbi:hypothetical protein DDIC_06205 [Desulfovibrio desulfuricans]|uniref:Uncharacterized protein n=1 Tax=Desulfovibrio desulfuricans TaxID=876 RepID=A0A4P7UKU8_DESDE|nr:hypothetical protein [Desulfovibrio desulfuricans]QCC85474.1 hypothetical protein DDIC_06205 [Desulfovibrio desulfuricans]